MPTDLISPPVCENLGFFKREDKNYLGCSCGVTQFSAGRLLVLILFPAVDNINLYYHLSLDIPRPSSIVFEFFSFSRLFLWISVVQITVFYIVLYAFLAGFFIALLTVFYQTLNDHEPKWTMGSSLIGNSPGESIKFFTIARERRTRVDIWWRHKTTQFG